MTLSAMAGTLSGEMRDGVLHTRLLIGLDFGLCAERGEPIRLYDDLLDGHPLREKLRELLLGEIKPLIERLGKVVRVVHHAPDALVILTAVPSGGEGNTHGQAPSLVGGWQPGFAVPDDFLDMISECFRPSGGRR